jgi:uncharacterized membrane protein
MAKTVTKIIAILAPLLAIITMIVEDEQAASSFIGPVWQILFGSNSSQSLFQAYIDITSPY